MLSSSRDFAYNSGPWEAIKASQKKKLSHCYFVVFRMIFEMRNVEDQEVKFNDGQVLAATRVIHP